MSVPAALDQTPSASCHLPTPEGRVLLADDTAQIPPLLVGRLGTTDLDPGPTRCCPFLNAESELLNVLCCYRLDRRNLLLSDNLF